MSLDFGKLDFVVSLNRKTAFPLDARSYFESFASAEAAARTAEAAGSKNTTYYFGQTICVVENNVASMYIIQPDGTLGEIGEKVKIDEKQFEFKDGSLSLIGFADAVAEAQLVKNADGTLGWVKPDNSVVQGLSTDVENLKIAIGAPADEENEASGIYAKLDEKANIADVYSKEDADQAIASAIAGVSHLKREIFDSKIAAEIAMVDYGDSADQYIYMVYRGLLIEDGNYYDEYMAFKQSDVWTLEKIGDWEVDLSAYAKTEDINQALDLKADKSEVNSAFNLINTNILNINTLLQNKVDKKDNYDLMSLDEREKLARIEEGAQVNLINEVDTAQFNVDAAGKLTLLNIAPSKVLGLEDVLKGGKTASGHRLITDKEADKLAALSFGEDGSVGISGTINASKVQELYDTVVNITTGKGTGLYDGEQKNLLAIEPGAQVNIINSVEEESFEIVDKKLILKNLTVSKISNLQDILNAKASQEEVSSLTNRVTSIEGMLTWGEI